LTLFGHPYPHLLIQGLVAYSAYQVVQFVRKEEEEEEEEEGAFNFENILLHQKISVGGFIKSTDFC